MIMYEKYYINVCMRAYVRVYRDLLRPPKSQLPKNHIFFAIILLQMSVLSDISASDHHLPPTHIHHILIRLYPSSLFFPAPSFSRLG